MSLSTVPPPGIRPTVGTFTMSEEPSALPLQDLQREDYPAQLRKLHHQLPKRCH